MSRPSRHAALLGVAGALACAPVRPPAFVPTGASFTSKDGSFDVVPPPGWMRVAASDDALVVTRDGTALQRIVVKASEVVAGRSDPRLRPGISIDDAADMVVAELRTGARVAAARAIARAPVTVSGRPGYRIIVSYNDVRGLPRRLAVYGIVDGSRYYELFLEAPARHYFDRDLPTLDELARTLRIRHPATTP